MLSLRRQIADAYDDDPDLGALAVHLRAPTGNSLKNLTRSLQSHAARCSLDGDLIVYSADVFDPPRVVVPNDADLRARIVHEYHDALTGGHLGREKTFAALSRGFYWPHLYKTARKWVRTGEVCQRVSPEPSSQAPPRPLPITSDAWKSVSMDFVFGLPRDAHSRTGVVVFVDRVGKMVHLAPVVATITAEETAAIFLDVVFRLHGLPESIVSDRDPRFTSAFWMKLFELLGFRLLMSTAAHTETDGQTERANRVLEDVLRSYATSYSSWSDFLPLAEFALSNAVHSSSGLAPFYVNHTRHSRVPVVLAVGGAPTVPEVSTLDGEESVDVGSAMRADLVITIEVHGGQVPSQHLATDSIDVDTPSLSQSLAHTADAWQLSPRRAMPTALWTAQTLIGPMQPVVVCGVWHSRLRPWQPNSRHARKLTGASPALCQGSCSSVKPSCDSSVTHCKLLPIGKWRMPIAEVAESRPCTRRAKECACRRKVPNRAQ